MVPAAAGFDAGEIFAREDFTSTAVLGGLVVVLPSMSSVVVLLT